MDAQLYTSSLLSGVDRQATQLYSSCFLVHKTVTPGRKYSGNKSIPNKTPGCKLQHGAQTPMQSKFISNSLGTRALSEPLAVQLSLRKPPCTEQLEVQFLGLPPSLNLYGAVLLPLTTTPIE